MKQPLLLYYNISLDVTAFSSTRHGGYSKGTYGEFNINPYCGDSPDFVLANRKALCEALSIQENALILPHQTHGTKIARIDTNFMSCNNVQQKDYLEGKDALITTEPNICIAVSTADCVPILLYSPERRIAAAIHAGWRGTLARITQKVATTLINDYNVSPYNLQAVIGPSISQQNFEVGNEVYDSFVQNEFDMTDTAVHINDKWHIDLWKINRLQLESCNIRMCNIKIAGICSYTKSNDFFSARRLGVNSGRTVTGIIIR